MIFVSMPMKHIDGIKNVRNVVNEMNCLTLNMSAIPVIRTFTFYASKIIRKLDVLQNVTETAIAVSQPKLDFYEFLKALSKMISLSSVLCSVIRKDENEC